MARGKVTTSNELKELNEVLSKKLARARKKADSVLTKVGGLRAHVAANNPSNEDVLRIIDSIIQDS
tara:strand:+ start:164 stop:361 length:198 start_codon:yes stop_codon:yes gene_type:complete